MITTKLNRVQTAIVNIKTAYEGETWWKQSAVDDLAALEVLYNDLETSILEEIEKKALEVSSTTLSADIVLKLDILTTPADLVDAFAKHYEAINNCYTGEFIEVLVQDIESFVSQAFTSLVELETAITNNSNLLGTSADIYSQDVVETSYAFYNKLIEDSTSFSSILQQINQGISSNSTLASTSEDLISALDLSSSPFIVDFNPSFYSSLGVVIPLIGTPVNEKFSTLMSQLNTALDLDNRISNLEASFTLLLTVFI